MVLCCLAISRFRRFIFFFLVLRFIRQLLLLLILAAPGAGFEPAPGPSISTLSRHHSDAIGAGFSFRVLMPGAIAPGGYWFDVDVIFKEQAGRPVRPRCRVERLDHAGEKGGLFKPAKLERICENQYFVCRYWVWQLLNCSAKKQWHQLRWL